MVILKNQGKGTEEQVENSQEYCREYAETETLRRSRISRCLLSRKCVPRWLTIGSKKSNWKGRIHDQRTVFRTDLVSISIAALQASLPVSFLSLRAFCRRRTGW